MLQISDRTRWARDPAYTGPAPMLLWQQGGDVTAHVVVSSVPACSGNQHNHRSSDSRTERARDAGAGSRDGALAANVESDRPRGIDTVSLRTWS